MPVTSGSSTTSGTMPSAVALPVLVPLTVSVHCVLTGLTRLKDCDNA
jgi:hypothetical protein